MVSIAFLGWFLEELPVRSIPTCSFLLYKQLIWYATLAIALSLFNAESIWYWYITLLSLDTILPFKSWYKHKVFWFRLGCKLWKLLVWNNIHNYEKSKKYSDLQIIAGAKVTTFAYGIMLPSIFEKHKRCPNHTKSLPVVNPVLSAKRIRIWWWNSVSLFDFSLLSTM